MSEPDIDRIALTFKRYVQRFAVSEDFLLDIDASIRDDFFGRYLFELKTKILCDDLPPETFTARERVTYEIPSSTWQMWKKRHGRRWYAQRLVARWPVRYQPDPDQRGVDAVCTFNLERYRSYPRARVQLPRDQFGVAVLVHGIRDLRWDLGEAQ